MATVEIVSQYRNDIAAHLRIRVSEPEGEREYLGVVELSELAGLTRAERRARMIAAVREQRNRTRTAPVELDDFTPGETVEI